MNLDQNSSNNFETARDLTKFFPNPTATASSSSLLSDVSVGSSHKSSCLFNYPPSLAAG